MKYFILAALLLITSISSAQIDTSINFSEVMFNPISGNNEFIELYNSSLINSIDLSGFKIRYYNSTADNIADAGFGTILPPKSFAVIFENDYNIDSGQYAGLIPPEALILKISDNSFGTSGMANTTSRVVKLINPGGDTLFAYTYSANNSAGFSDEKLIQGNNNSSTNWSNSLVSNGTPGFRNSISPFQFDLSVWKIYFDPALPQQGDNLIIYANVKNIGSESASNYSVIFYNDINFDSMGAASEIISSDNYFNLAPDDSLIIQASINNVVQGNYNFIVKLIYPEDENQANNIKYGLISISPPPVEFNAIVLNEIMYAPTAGQPEWIELYNRGISQINLKNFKLADNSTTVTVTSADKFISPGEYVILSRDSSIRNFYNLSCELITFNLPSLNNSGDAVVLKDALGNIVDSLTYFTNWGGSGVSLERISVDESSTSSTNWGSCISPNKATPCGKNSITQKDYDLLLAEFIPIRKYVTTGSDAQFNIKVKNRGKQTALNFNINLYKDVNFDSIPQSSELIDFLNINSLFSNDSISTIFNTSSLTAGAHYFIGHITFSNDEDTTNNIAFAKLIAVSINEVREDIIINEIMYAPASGEPEWIELYNRSSKTIDLKNYSIADNSDTVKVAFSSIELFPNEYLVIADDSTISNYYQLPGKNIIKNFPALNNSGDKLIVLDSLFRIIDSTRYYTSWGGTNGKSLEKILIGGSSIDSTNWKSTKRKTGGTPGAVNSVSPKDYDVEAVKILFNPRLPVYGDDVEIGALVRNIGTQTSDVSLKLYSDTNLDSIPDVLLESIPNNILQAGDSSIIFFVSKIVDIQSSHGFYIFASSLQDEDTTNNYITAVVVPGSGHNSIVINEIMYKPAGEPEWIEFYNHTDKEINLKNWRIKDASSSSGAVIKTDEIILPKTFFVIARDSSIYSAHRLVPSKTIFLNLPALNNDNDAVIFIDDRGAAIDSIYYYDEWSDINNSSLERQSFEVSSLLSSNWGSSLDLENSTPGRINSITIKNKDVACTAISTTPLYPAPGDDVTINLKIKNLGITNADLFSVIFLLDEDKNGTFEKTIEIKDNLSLLKNDSLIITTTSKLKIINELTCAALIVYEGDDDTLNNFAQKIITAGYKPETVLISELIYNPKTGFPEWVEFINVSSDSIELNNWMISDVLPSPKKDFIIKNPLAVKPNEYFIVTPDSSFINLYPAVKCKIFISNFGALGNSSDGICIYDFRGAVIDSLKYSSKWGGEKGFSLERISFTNPSNDSSNWMTSLNINGSTPGFQNSSFNSASYKKNDAVINEIMFDPDIDNCEYIELYNSGSDTINLGGWKIYTNDDIYKITSVPFMLPPKKYFVFAADSIIIGKYKLQSALNSIAGISDFGLSAAGEVIIVKDIFSNVIDSIYYSDKWHNKNFLVTKNRSLERIAIEVNSNNPSNWSSCVSDIGGTPGNENSIFAASVSASSGILVSPNPFSPDNDGFEDHTIINYSLNQIVSQVRLKVFDSKGRIVRTLLNNYTSGSKGSLIFDGRDDEGNALRMGIYIIFMEALNETNGVVQTLKTTVVIARKLN